MSSDLSQFDIPNRQLLATGAQSRVDIQTDIGEAKITQTIFGRAKIRVIREQDKTRRAWLLTSLAVAVVAVAAWQGWATLQQMQSAALLPSETVRVSAPVFQPEYIPLPATSLSQGRKPGTPPQTEINDLMSTLKSMPQQSPGLKPSVQMAAQPQPLIASTPQPDKPQTDKQQTDKQQTAPLATNNSSAKNQTDVQQPPKPLPPRQPPAPSVAKPSATQPVAKTVVATPPATQPATNKPAAIAPLAQPTSKENSSIPSPAVSNQTPGTVNAQPPVITQP